MHITLVARFSFFLVKRLFALRSILPLENKTMREETKIKMHDDESVCEVQPQCMFLQKFRTWPRETTLCQESTLNLVMLGRFCQQLIDFGRERARQERGDVRWLLKGANSFSRRWMLAASLLLCQTQRLSNFTVASISIQKANSSKFSFIQFKFNYCSFRVSKITIVIHNNFCNTYNGQFMTFLSF